MKWKNSILNMKPSVTSNSLVKCKLNLITSQQWEEDALNFVLFTLFFFKKCALKCNEKLRKSNIFSSNLGNKKSKFSFVPQKVYGFYDWRPTSIPIDILNVKFTRKFQHIKSTSLTSFHVLSSLMRSFCKLKLFIQVIKSQCVLL